MLLLFAKKRAMFHNIALNQFINRLKQNKLFESLIYHPYNHKQ